MNIDTGHIVRESDLAQIIADRHKYERVPPSLAGDAERVLAGRSQGHVNMRVASPLTAWAKRRRKERRKAEKAARKAARRG